MTSSSEPRTTSSTRSSSSSTRPKKCCARRWRYEFYHYPLDFLERYRSQVENVTAADVARVAQKYLHKDQMAILVVGNQAEFDKPLSSLGSVQKVDISIPPPPASLMGSPGAEQ